MNPYGIQASISAICFSFDSKNQGFASLKTLTPSHALPKASSSAKKYCEMRVNITCFLIENRYHYISF
ncbi:hypothetical protein [Comamonas aquatilis]|uniref:hypothetical protein n=1 Tax=Comamonas aquatilis TaxID=1778406 RepID=UPI0039EE137A